MKSRRKFLEHLLAGSAAGVLGAGIVGAPQIGAQQPAVNDAEDWPVAIFEKVFEGLTYHELADVVAEIGADGIEATIRPGGHIAPQSAAVELPKLVAALAQRGKRIVIAATDITAADQQGAEPLLRLLKANGVTHYRLGYYHYDKSRSPLEQVAGFAKSAAGLAALNQEIGIQGLYQNHSGGGRRGGYVGALGWDAALLLREIDPDAIGIALDTRHLRKDTGSSWQTAVAVCKPHVRSIYVKDGVWFGDRSLEYKDVPLDTGFVNAEVFRHIRAGLAPMPICIHMEWLGYRVFEKAEIPQAIEAHQRDIAALRRWLRG